MFSGQDTPEDIVSFRTYAAKRNKDELGLLQPSQKVRELKVRKVKLPVKLPKPPNKGKGGKGPGQQDA